MKKLYILFLFISLAFFGNQVVAQVRSSNTSPLYSQSKEHAFSGDRIIDPRSDVMLFPNPAVDFLIVEIKSQELTNISFELNNIIGSTFEIRSESLGSNRYKIYVKDLNQGYYFLTIKDANSSYKRAYRFLKK